MRKLFLALLSACLSLSAGATTPQGFTTIMATNVVDAGGNPLASGTATFQVVDANARPMSVQVANGGQVVTAPVTVPVTIGTFSALVVDVSQTSPSFPCVVLTITNNVDGSVVWQNKCLQPTGAVYDLDQFSTNTTPVAPQAGDTVAGNLGVNGNLNVTGNLNIGGLNVGVITGAVVTTQVTNGVINPTAYSGADLPTQISNAVAIACASATLTSGGCHIKIPVGTYTFSSTITLPRLRRMILECDPGAFLNYTGSSYAVFMNNNGNGPEVIGCTIFGTSSGKAGINAGSSYANGIIQFNDIENFSSGEGIVDFGANTLDISHNTIRDNFVGIHLLGSAGFASNAVHIHQNNITSNTYYNIVDGDFTNFPNGWPGGNNLAGVSSANFNNTIEQNDLEAGGTGSVFLAYTNGEVIQNNYFEATGGPEIVVGCSGVTAPSQYATLFGTTAINCLNSQGATIQKNYFTSTLHDEIFLLAAINTSVGHNSETTSTSGPSPCFVDVASATGFNMGPNNITASSHFCQGGSAMTPALFAAFVGPNTNDGSFGINGPTIYFNTAGGPQSGTNIQYLTLAPLGPATPNNPENGGGSNPYCTPTAHIGATWVSTTTGRMWVCEADSILTTAQTPNPSDGNGTWIAK